MNHQVGASRQLVARERRGGFSFTELLFAVMILGVGFILVAAMLPVGIEQTRETSEQTVAAEVARSAVEQLQAVAGDGLMRETFETNTTPPFADARYQKPLVFAFRNWPANHQPLYPFYASAATSDVAWQQVSAKQVYAEDPRYASVPVYSRAKSSPYVQLFVIVCKAKHRETYTAADLVGNPATLQPKPVRVFLSEGGTGPDIVEILEPPTVTPAIPSYTNAAAEGSFLIVRDDRANPGGLPPQVFYWKQGDPVDDDFYLKNIANGRVYRLGKRRPDLDQAQITGSGRPGTIQRRTAYELAAGWDMIAGPAAGSPGPDRAMVPSENNNQNLPLEYTGASATPQTRGAIGTNLPAADGFIVGRAWTDPADHSKGFTGDAPDVGFFTTYIRIR